MGSAPPTTAASTSLPHPAGFLRAQKDQAVRPTSSTRARPAVTGRFPVGLLHHREREEYMTALREVSEPAEGGPRNGGAVSAGAAGRSSAAGPRSAAPAPAGRVSSWRRRSSPRPPRPWAKTSCRRRPTGPRPAAAPPRPRSSSPTSRSTSPRSRSRTSASCSPSRPTPRSPAAPGPAACSLYDTGLVEIDPDDHPVVALRSALHPGRLRRARQEGRDQHRRRRRAGADQRASCRSTTCARRS